MALSISTPAFPDAIAARSSWLMYMPRGGLRLWRAPNGAPRLPPAGPDVGLNSPVRLYNNNHNRQQYHDICHNYFCVSKNLILPALNFLIRTSNVGSRNYIVPLWPSLV